MEEVAIKEIIAKVATNAPVLLPDVLKILGDLGLVATDCAKLMADYQTATGTPLIAPAAKAQ